MLRLVFATMRFATRGKRGLSMRRNIHLPRGAWAEALESRRLLASMLADLNLTPYNGSPNYFTTSGSTLFFGSANGLWKTDGTGAGSVKLSSIRPSVNLSPGNAMAALPGGRVAYVSDLSGARNLMVSAGTE